MRLSLGDINKLTSDFKQSPAYFLNNMRWQLDPDTFQVLGENCWIGYVTTTHLQARGETERSFYVLVCHGQYVTLDKAQLDSLVKYVEEGAQQ